MSRESITRLGLRGGRDLGLAPPREARRYWGSGGTGCGLLGGPVYLLPVPRDAHPGHANAAVSATLLVPERVRSGPMSCCGASAAVW